MQGNKESLDGICNQARPPRVQVQHFASGEGDLLSALLDMAHFVSDVQGLRRKTQLVQRRAGFPVVVDRMPGVEGFVSAPAVDSHHRLCWL